MEKYCISVDWLQVYCRGNYISEGLKESAKHCVVTEDGEVEIPLYMFSIKLLGYSTPLFKNVFEASLNGMVVASITSTPKTPVMARDAVIVKLENRVLYSHQYIELLYALLNALNLEYLSVTRLDLCYDCNKLKGGKSVEDFLFNFLTIPPKTLGHMVRKGSTRFMANGAKKWHESTKVTSMRWGSPNVSPAGYCYNKTLELIEVKDKPWIRATWNKNGLISFVKNEELNKLSEKQKQYETDMFSLKDYVVTPVWRFEVSIKSDGNKLLDMGTGELIRLSPVYMTSQKYIEDLFYTYAKKVFDFKVNTGQKNTRFYHDVELFEHGTNVTLKPIRIQKNADTGRSERMCYNKLLAMTREYTDLAEQHVWGLREALNFLSETAGLKQEIVRKKEYESYLNEILGHKFCREDIDLLLAEIQRCNDTRNEINRMDSEGMIYP